MDRNSSILSTSYTLLVALRKESVDRNLLVQILRCCSLLSLSARRAWIEILIKSSLSFTHFVALRKESVDRNQGSLGITAKQL